MVTIHDVAQRAGVSAATVSRVVNGQANVAPALAERVRAAIRELDYRGNAAARNLRRNRSSLWAVVISDIGNAFFTSLVRGIEDVAAPLGFSVVLCNTDDNLGKEGQYIDAALAEQMAGVVISPSGSAQHIKRLLAAGTPVVAIDRVLKGAAVDTVVVDNEGGAEAAVTHLFESGYERIACITGPVGATTADRRLDGYRRALEARGQRPSERLIRRADFREQGGHDAMASLLDEAPDLDAVFAGNNLMTIGALGCLVERGISVPGELGVIGFDDIPWAGLVRPSLSTVAQPTYELGRTAAELLSARLARPARPVSTVTLSTELRVRESSVRSPG
ncbi:LacI family DNA-binding transcriptional regulator [Streptomyces sp. NPDC055749]